MLRIERGEGIEGADSLVSLVEAEDYFERKRLLLGEDVDEESSIGWIKEKREDKREAKIEAKKELLLKQGSKMLGLFPWKGIKLRESQSLVFPRKAMGKGVGIPEEVKELCMELANQVLEKGFQYFEGGAREWNGQGASGVSEIQMGSLRVGFQEDYSKGYAEFVLSMVPGPTRAGVLGFMHLEEGVRGLSVTR